MSNERPPTESSGYLVDYQGEKRAITGVIHQMELEGEQVRARLLKSLRETILATRRAKELAQQFADSLGPAAR